MADGGDVERPPLTVTIATNDGWATVKRAYDAVRAQAEAHGAEIILVDGSHEQQPKADELGPTTQWINQPGADISEMRCRAYRQARGEVVSMTEDHVEVGPDWVEQTIRVHDEHPEVAAVGGGVRNGTPRNVIDWASFYSGHAPFLDPVPTGPAEFLSGVNVSYKRAPLQAALDRLGSDRAIETLINEEIKAAGGKLWSDSRLVVTHFQSRGIAGTTRLHFYAGRHFEGTRRMSIASGPTRLARAAMLPFPRAGKRLATALRRGQPVGRVLRVAPAIVIVFSAQAIGEMTGILAGPGRAATKLH